MSEFKPTSTPLKTKNHLTINDGTPLPNPKDYRSFVGALQYLSLTRLDVTFSVNKLSQFTHRPTETHWAILIRLL